MDGFTNVQTVKECEESYTDSMDDFEDESDIESSMPERRNLDVQKLLTKKSKKNEQGECMQTLYNCVVGGIVLAVIVIAGSCTEWFGFIPNTTIPEELFEGDREGLKLFEQNAALVKNPTTANGMMGMVQNFMPEGGMEDMMAQMQDAMGQFGGMMNGDEEDDEDKTKSWKAPTDDSNNMLSQFIGKDGQLNTNNINNMLDQFAGDTMDIDIGEAGEKFLAERNIERKVRVSRQTTDSMNKYFEAGWDFSRRSVADPTDIQFQGTLKKEHMHANKETVLGFLAAAWNQNKGCPEQSPQFPNLRYEFYSYDTMAKNPKDEDVMCPGFWQCTSAMGCANPSVNWENADVWSKARHDYLNSEESIIAEGQNGCGRSLNIQVKFDRLSSTNKSVAAFANTTPDLRGPRQDDSNNPLYLALQNHLATTNFSGSKWEQMHVFLTSPYDMNGKGDMNNVFKEFEYEFRFHFVGKGDKAQAVKDCKKSLETEIFSDKVLRSFMSKRQDTAKQCFNADRRNMSGYYDESPMKYQWQNIQFNNSFEASSRHNAETKLVHLEGKFTIKFATAPSMWSKCSSVMCRCCAKPWK